MESSYTFRHGETTSTAAHCLHTGPAAPHGYTLTHCTNQAPPHRLPTKHTQRPQRASLARPRRLQTLSALLKASPAESTEPGVSQLSAGPPGSPRPGGGRPAPRPALRGARLRALPGRAAPCRAVPGQAAPCRAARSQNGFPAPTKPAGAQRPAPGSRSVPCHSEAEFELTGRAAPAGPRV